jgi:anthranilate/para-aminobenzoate synthase component I
MSKLTVVTKETLADTDTAVSAYLKLCLNRPGSVLLESAETHDSVGRYSIIAFDPIIRMELRADGVTVQNGGAPEPSSPEPVFRSDSGNRGGLRRDASGRTPGRGIFNGVHRVRRGAAHRRTRPHPVLQPASGHG